MLEIKRKSKNWVYVTVDELKIYNIEIPKRFCEELFGTYEIGKHKLNCDVWISRNYFLGASYAVRISPAFREIRRIKGCVEYRISDERGMFTCINPRIDYLLACARAMKSLLGFTPKGDSLHNVVIKNGRVTAITEYKIPLRENINSPV